MMLLPVFRWLGLGILALVLVTIVLPFAQFALGYYVFTTGWEVAEKLVEEGKSVDECRKIMEVPWNMIGPSTGAQRRLCIFTYASLTKDPSACELLLPSEYGLACLSDLWTEALPDDGCNWSAIDATVFECKHRDGPLRRSALCPYFRDSPKQFSACIFFSALKAKDIQKCSEALDELIRTLCTAKINAWLKYPKLRNSFYFGTQGNAQLESP